MDLDLDVIDYRYGYTNNFLTDGELRTYILALTDGVYENGSVLAERTGIRPNILFDRLLTDFQESLVTGIYLATVVERCNPDPNTRYLILAHEADFPDWLVDYISPSVPILLIPNYHSDFDISSWFRANMGSAYSFIDIDYIIALGNALVLLEEKDTYTYDLRYGQKKSYSEMMNDVLNVPSVAIINFLKSNEYQRMHSSMAIEPLNIQSYDELYDRIIQLDEYFNS